MIITYSCQIMENSSPEELFHILIGQMQFTAHLEDVFIRSRFAVQGPERSCMEFFATSPVESLRQEVILTVQQKQTAWL